MTDAYASIAMKLEAAYPNSEIHVEYDEYCIIDMRIDERDLFGHVDVRLDARPSENYYSCRVFTDKSSLRYRGESWETIYAFVLEFVHILLLEL